MFEEYARKYKRYTENNPFRMFGLWFFRNKTTGIYETEPDESEHESQEVKVNWPEKHRVKTDTDWRAVGIQTALSAITVGLLFATVHYARKQWGEAREANQISRASLESVQRAFISLKGFGYSENLAAKTLGFAAVFENSGTTPTRTMRTHLNIDTPETKYPEGYSFPDSLTDSRPTSQTVVGPKGITIMDLGNILPFPYAEAALNHQRHIYVYGWAAYRDILPNTSVHVTEFCSEVVITGRRPEGNPSWLFSFTSWTEHNCYDQDCKDYREIAAKLN